MRAYALALALLTPVLATSCSSDEIQPPPPTTDASLDVGPDIGTSPCDSCGYAEQTGRCAQAAIACSNDPGCSAIRDCVFGLEDAASACALDDTGAPCVRACVSARCQGQNGVTLYYALDQCVYCGACRSSCSVYCDGFGDAAAPSCGDGG